MTKRTEYDTTKGRFPSNVLISHHEKCVRVGVRRVKGITGGKNPHQAPATIFPEAENRAYFDYADPDGFEVVAAWECVENCPVKILDEQAVKGGMHSAGKTRSGGQSKQNQSGGLFGVGQHSGNGMRYGDSGSASRFFYTPKAPPREKWFYCEICDDCYPYKERDDHAHGKAKGKRKHQIAHPTVKPLSIAKYAFGVLEYLCRLTKTPTGGIVLDPFAGSGTTLLAALANGRDCIGIENDPIYHRIAEKRIKEAMAEPRQLELL